jgi:hypothetical protein
MLVTQVHIPEMYRSREGEVGDLTRAAVLGALRDVATRNATLLLDGGAAGTSVVWQAISRLVEDWPHDDKKRAKTLFESIGSRAVRVPTIATQGSACAAALDVAVQERPDAVVGPRESTCGVLRCTRAPAFVSISAYAPVADRIHRASEVTLAYGQSDANTFENKVLVPVFRYARHVKIFDRQIGRSARAAVLGSAKSFAGFERSLDWLVECFGGISTRTNGATFEIHTEVPPGDASPAREAARRLLATEERWAEAGGVRARFIIKASGPGGVEMNHDRFLFTDQIRLQFGRGFDLLTPSHRVRDVTITSGRFKGIETQFANLPDFRSA